MITLETISAIDKLSKLSIGKLRKLNPERAYNGKDLTRHQLIFQIINLMDSPNE